MFVPGPRVAAALVAWALVAVACPALAVGGPEWLVGDVHTHTYLTDGWTTHSNVATHAFGYGVGYLANSEHGGRFSRDAYGRTLSSPMWRWLSLARQSWPRVAKIRSRYPNRMLIQGLEWNPPGLDHASVGIVTDEPAGISEFEYRFDAHDYDTSRPALEKRNLTREDAASAVQWLESTYPGRAYVILNHPARVLGTSAAEMRALNDAAPETVIGFEGFPGHQRSVDRGGYHGGVESTRTMGGADPMLARVGGTWDALLGEGRRFWAFGNSDFHSSRTDFWPGQYVRTYTRVERRSYDGVVAGMASGASFTVSGGLVRALSVTATGEGDSAGMGESLAVRPGADVTVTVSFRVPKHTSDGHHPSLDHLDLIVGQVGDRAQPGSSAYTSATNPTARIERSWTPRSPWRGYSDWGTTYRVTHTLHDVRAPIYIRLRGTNLDCGVAGQTDALGNPLPDALGMNSADAAWRDCWLYSNPVFVDVAQ